MSEWPISDKEVASAEPHARRIAEMSEFPLEELIAKLRELSFGWPEPLRVVNRDRRDGYATILYFIQCGQFVKVGITTDMEKRVRALKAGNPYPLRVASMVDIPSMYDRLVEKRIHGALHVYAVGREWFRLVPKDARRVAMPIVRSAWAKIAEHERQTA